MKIPPFPSAKFLCTLLWLGCGDTAQSDPERPDGGDNPRTDASPDRLPDAAIEGPACTTSEGTNGSCVTTRFDELRCPDGTRYDRFESEGDCAPAGDRTVCCEPWSESCTFVASTWTIDVDPFTCLPATVGRPWRCLNGPEQIDCQPSAQLFEPVSAPEDATVTIEVGTGGMMTVRGTHNVSGATFECSGLAPTYFTFPEEWTCSACDGAGPDAECGFCTAEVVEDCLL